jgi:hypothetical protein
MELGTILDEFGFSPVLDQLVSEIMNPIAACFFQHVGKLDEHHAFTVEYSVDGKDRKLDFHV